MSSAIKRVVAAMVRERGTLHMTDQRELQDFCLTFANRLRKGRMLEADSYTHGHQNGSLQVTIMVAFLFMLALQQEWLRFGWLPPCP